MTQKVAATNLRTFRTFLLMQQFAAAEIGRRIAQARAEAGAMTQEQLGELLNVSKRSIQDYEGGVTIPWKHFQAMEEIFKTPMAWFLHGESPASDPQRQIPLELRERAEGLLDRLDVAVHRLEGLEGEIRRALGER